MSGIFFDRVFSQAAATLEPCDGEIHRLGPKPFAISERWTIFTSICRRILKGILKDRSLVAAVGRA